MMSEYKGWEISVIPTEEEPGRWRIAGAARIVASQFRFERPLNDTRVFSSKREALIAGVAIARAWIDNRDYKDHPLTGREASARQEILLDKTADLWEALRHFRQEGEAEIDRRRQQGKPVTDPPFDLPKLTRAVQILEDAVRKGMDDMSKYLGAGGVFGDDWMRRREERFREGLE